MFSEDTNITPLNFSNKAFGKSYIDKKLGLEIHLGLVNALPKHALHYGESHKNIALALEDKGMGQELMDLECQKFNQECKNHQIELLITKNDYPLDNRWFWIGDLEKVFEYAKEDRILCPLSAFLYDELHYEIQNYQE